MNFRRHPRGHVFFLSNRCLLLSLVIVERPAVLRVSQGRLQHFLKHT
jgi:hypothetical protein